MPHVSELAKLTEAASAGALARAAFGADLSSLRAAMEAVRAPWLREGRLAESALGFGELQAMGALLRRQPPFAKTVSAALRLDLGDWRDEIAMPIAALRDAVERSRFYVGRGLNRALTDFTPRAFDESLEAAGLMDAGRHAGRLDPEARHRRRERRDRGPSDRLRRLHRLQGHHRARRQLECGLPERFRTAGGRPRILPASLPGAALHHARPHRHTGRRDLSDFGDDAPAACDPEGGLRGRRRTGSRRLALNRHGPRLTPDNDRQRNQSRSYRRPRREFEPLSKSHGNPRQAPPRRRLI